MLSMCFGFGVRAVWKGRVGGDPTSHGPNDAGQTLKMNATPPSSPAAGAFACSIILGIGTAGTVGICPFPR